MSTTTNSPNDIPKHPHFAVVVFSSVTIPGDERSRTNPGHGYPEHTETHCQYIVFARLEELEQWVAKQSEWVRFIPINVFPLTIERTVSVKVPSPLPRSEK